MGALRGMTLRGRFILIIMATSMTSLLVACAGFATYDVISASSQICRQLNVLAMVIAENTTAALAFGDEAAAVETLRALRAEPGVLAARVFTPADEPFASYVAEGSAGFDFETSLSDPEIFRPFDNYVVTHVPVMSKGDRLGTVEITCSLDQLWRQVTEACYVLALLLFCCFLLALSFSRHLQASVVKPILDLNLLAQRISASQDYSLRAVCTTNDEVGDLTNKLNEMLEQIQKRDVVLQEYSSQLEAQVQKRTHQLRIQNKEFRLAKEMAEAANVAKSEFLANISHELRTPMHGILSFAGFGLRKFNTVPIEKLRDYFEKVDICGRRLMTLLNDLLDLSKLEAGKMTFEFTPMDLGGVVASIVDEFSSLLSERNLECVFASKVNVKANVDPQRIGQVLRNLLNNAVKFSPAGSTIEISMSERDGIVVVCVEDRGLGVPPDELEAIFDKFIQSGRTKSGAGGTGLGLSICREIIQAHRGRIWAENREGGGSSFRFEIPCNLAGTTVQPVTEDGDAARESNLEKEAAG